MIFFGGLIDFLLFGVLLGCIVWWWVIIVGFVLVVIYYFGFCFVICKWNLKIFGCEVVNVNDGVGKVEVGEFFCEVLVVFGGKENIVFLDVCIICLCV